MPATPTTPRTPSTRISRRTSSRSVAADDQPSTSSAAPPPAFAPPISMETDESMDTEEIPVTPPQKKKISDELDDEVEEEAVEAEDIAVVKEKTPEPAPREKKPVDRRGAYICAILLAENRAIHDRLVASNEIPGLSEKAKKEQEARIKPVIDQIRRVEHLVLKRSIEEVLEDPRCAVMADLSTPPEKPPREPEQPTAAPIKTMQPIEVKIEDTDGTQVPSTSSVMPSASGALGENNVERAAKREAHVLARIAELRKNGLWSNTRLPKCVEPERNKTHWDYLLEEVKWMATDFRAETNSKRRIAKVIAHAIAKQHRDKQIEVARAAEREIKEKRKMCAGVAKMVREFWQGVDKLVDFRANEIRTARLRKAKNKHLMFVLGQVDGLSSIVQDGLVASKTPSIASHDDNDKEFEAGSESEEDDEQTIDREEKAQNKEQVRQEVDALHDEATADMDDFLTTLPPEYLEAYGITKEDVEEMKREKKEAMEKSKRAKEEAAGKKKQDEQEEGMDVDDEPTTSSANDQQPSTSTKKPSKDEEKLQDPTAEDGNGDGRGVLENVDYTKLNSNDSDERQQELANIAEEALKFQPKGYTLETTQVKTPVPFLVRGVLREYQMVGLDWMVTLYEKNLNGILADEMGLGKTIQTISLLAHLACSESIWGPHLIVVPTSVILNWEMEFKKWCPALKIMTYFGTAKERQEKRKGWMKPNCFHVCITSYKTVTQDIRSFKQRAWQYLILDEAQNIKNWKSQRWQALLNVRARRRLLLTGTPLQNSLMELWSLMHFLMPTIFSSHDDFKDWFSNPLTGMMEGSMEFNAPLIGRLHKVLRPFILRRLKKEVEKQLPEKTEHVIHCSLSKRQRYLYDDFMSRRSTKDNLKSGNMMSVLNIVMQLRKCCNHPNLFEPRPVLAPFVIPKLQMDVPAYLFDIAHQTPGLPDIPDIFNLNKIGYQPTSAGIYSSRKPLVEELEGMQANILQEQRIPEVEGFRFNRTAFVMKNPHHRGIGEESEDEGGVRVSNGVNGVAHLTNGHGINGHTVNGPSSSTSSGITVNGRPQTATLIRSKTVVNPAPLTISTDRSGFHYNMANHGRSRLDDHARHSPPLKRAKLTGAAINWADYVPQHVIEKMEESRRNQLQIVSRRFGMVRAPIIPLEMVALIREEILADFPRLVTDEEASVQEGLMDYVDLLVQRFGMYVEPVLTDAWQCRPSSSGLPSYIRNNMSDIEKDSRTLLLKSSSRLDTQMSISRSLQFPELRLIEYDCGKLQTLALLLRQLYAYKHRCLIFTQMSKMLDVLQTFLSHHGYQYFRLDGTTGVEQRQAMMERFNADSKVFCFILSTRSGGVGVNLTGADTVIFYDSDWNPTMDAQAQDRCHRIGQTRNVSIYRLISERTIEENILKKATQKRRLGELAIDEAGFTPEFFKQSDNIRDLFDGEDVEVTAPEDVPMNEKDMEKAMAKCEDEADVNAAKVAVAEARVDNAEFDERVQNGAGGGGMTLAEEEADEKYLELIQGLKPIERYAVNLLETQYKPEFEEECKEAEAQIDQKRDEWDKNLNELTFDINDPENVDNLLNMDDDDFYRTSKEEELKFMDELNEAMPIWLPPSPPSSDADFDLRMEDDCLDLVYEIELMSEARLPQVTHEMRRPLAEKQKQTLLSNDILLSKEKDSVYDSIAKCLQLPDQPAAASPAYTENSFSMDDTSQDAIVKMEPHTGDNPISVPVVPSQQSSSKKVKKARNDNKSAPNRTGESCVKRATTPPPAFREEVDYDGAEWNIVEDYALLQAVQLEITHAHLVEKSALEGMVMNWELVANAVNKQTRYYRSARQCSIRYQMFVRPKELGQLVASDPISKKTMKVDLSTTELAHLRRGRMTTESQYAHDYGVLTDRKHVNRFRTVKATAARRQVQFWRGPRVLETRNLQSLEFGIPQRHQQKMEEFKVQTGVIYDAEEYISMSDDAIDTYEKSRKRLMASRQQKPSPRQDIRFHTLVKRPYAVPISTEYAAMPHRKDMIIAVPPLAPAPIPAAVPMPLPPIHLLQPQHHSHQQQQQHPINPHHQGPPGPSGSSGGGLGSSGVNSGNSGGPGAPMGGGGGGGGGHHHGHGGGHTGHHSHQHQGAQGSSHQGPLPSLGSTIHQQQQHQQHQQQHQQIHHQQPHHQPTQLAPIRPALGHHHSSEGSLNGPQSLQSQSHQLIQQGSQGQHSGNQMPPTIQRRTASGTNVQFLPQQPGQQGGYVVMGSQGSQQDGGVQGPPQQSQLQQQLQQGQPQQQQQQRVQYVPQGGAGGGGGRGTYASAVVMQRGGGGGGQGGGRVVRPTGMQSAGRMFIDNRHQYANVVPVRVMPANGQQPQRMVSGGQRRPPVPGTVAAMVLPNRGNGGVSQMRTMHLSRRGAYSGNGGGQQQRINVMVQPQNMRSAGVGQGGQMISTGGPGGQGQGPPAIRRQLVGRQLQRIDNNPQVAQVVVAPPQGMQAPGGGPPVLHMQRPSQQSMQMSVVQQQHQGQGSQGPPPPPTQIHGSHHQQQQHHQVPIVTSSMSSVSSGSSGGGGAQSDGGSQGPSQGSHGGGGGGGQSKL